MRASCWCATEAPGDGEVAVERRRPAVAGPDALGRRTIVSSLPRSSSTVITVADHGGSRRGADREPFEVDARSGVADAGLGLVLRLLADLRRHEAEHDELVVGDESSGSNVPDRSSSYSSSSRWAWIPPANTGRAISS